MKPSERQQDIDKLIKKEDLQRAKLRQKMTFFRSIHVAGDGTRLDDDIDKAIERCLHELIGENLCMMAVQQVTVTQIILTHFSEQDPRRYQYIVTILAKPIHGYPQETPQSRVTGYRNRHALDTQSESEGKECV